MLISYIYQYSTILLLKSLCCFSLLKECLLHQACLFDPMVYTGIGLILEKYQFLPLQCNVTIKHAKFSGGENRSAIM